MSPGREGIEKQLPQELGIPNDLLNQTTERFDELLQQGQILWQPFEAENSEDKGFTVQFQTAPHLRQKPANHAKSKGETGGAKVNPFLNPDPSFILARPGPVHTLILNRYPVYRDSLLIHTNEFKLQGDDLDNTDLMACWDSLQAVTNEESRINVGRRQWIMIYNCGYEAGSSQGHKHMQLWPIPSPGILGFELFPNRVESTTNITTLSDIPFKQFILRLPKGSSTENVIEAHAKLLTQVKRCHEAYGSSAYNVAMTKDWMMLVPRQSSGSKWKAGGNTAAVLGLLWISGVEEKARWDDYGIADHMARLGIPNTDP